MTTTLKETKQELYEKFCSDPDAGKPHASLTRTEKVYAYEPGPGQRVQGISIAVQTAGLAAFEWFFAVKVYADISTGPQKAQEDLDVTIQEVEALLGNDELTEQAEMEVKFDPEIQALIAIWKVRAGRGDWI